jgi:bifunctional ADP-heptose synthase (sugar kinase/adenylyltransferase)
VYVKGGDFAVADLPAEERAVVEQAGGRILTLGLVPGRSTTRLLERLRGAGG